MIPSFAIEPDVPRDPLAAAENAEWAAARRFAVLGLAVDERARRMFACLERLDELLAALEAGGPGQSQATLVDESELLETDAPEESAIELSPDEISDADLPDVVEAFVAAGARPREQFASAETIVLSGPDIRRKIRHKQSIMPSYAAQVLYEDIGALFAIGDREGALISLERLLTIAPISPQIEAFLAHNEARLLEYYESVLGPFTRVPRLRKEETGMPPPYFAIEKVAGVAQYVDGERSLEQVAAACGLRRIEACAVLSQLSRSSSLDLGDKPAAP